MATLAELERAFVAADDAGNSEDAAAFAAEIRRIKRSQPSKVSDIPMDSQASLVDQIPGMPPQRNIPNVHDKTFAESMAERYLPSMSAGTEQFLRNTAKGAASGPMMGAVQLGAGMFGRKDIADKIAANQREGNFLGTLMQPEAWLMGGKLAEVAKGARGMLAGGTTGGLYGGLSAVGDSADQTSERLTSAGFGAGFGVIPGLAGSVKDWAKSTRNVFGAAAGKQGAIDQLASDAANRLAGADKQFIESALRSRTQFVPGVTPTAAEAIAEKSMGQSFQKGGATIRMQKTLSGAVGAEDVLPSAIRAQEAAVRTYREGVENSLSKVRNSLLRRANKVGVDTTQVLNDIGAMLSTPGTREAEMVKSVLPKIANKIANMKQSSPGVVDARDIYALRKNMYKTIKDFSKESGTWDKKLGASLERDIQLAIDKSIDRALGNNMWSNGYMKPYSDRMAAIRAHEARLDAAKEIAKQVKSSGTASVTTGEVPQLPNVLSRPISVINYGLKKILGDANTPVARELARRMADPDEYAKLLALPRGNPTRELVEKVLAVSGGQMIQKGAE